MKKYLIIFALGIMACQKEDDEDDSPFVGTWKVIEMGQYAVATCSGEIDDTEWRGAKGKGISITMELRDDGTGTETITGPDAEVTNFAWYHQGETVCFLDGCYIYEMASNKLSFFVNTKEEAFCMDEDYNVTGHSSKRDCENANTSNEWHPETCSKVRYKKDV